MLQVLECGAADAPRWNDYVHAHDAGSFFHLYGWREVFERGLDHRTFYLAAEVEGRIVAVLPLVYTRSLIFGKTLSSMPFTTFAGTLADSADARALLENRALEIARGLGVGVLEYRLRAAGEAGRAVKSLYDIFTKPIEADDDANMKAIRSKQRNVIRKGIKNGLVARADSLENFYPTYAESVRNLGTPVFPKRLFQSIESVFGEHVEIISACLDDRVISSSMNFFYKDWVCPYYWGGKFEARRLNGNDFLAWSIMQRATERGCSVFDFGRSKRDTGAYAWKINLGFVAEPLHYEYELVRDKDVPDVNPLNPKYRLMIETWKKLPLPVASALGPLLSRTLG